MLIIHGENTIKSRDKLTSLVQAARAAKLDVLRLLGKELTLAVLEEAFAASSLFGTDKIIVIEELHSLPKSGKKEQLIAAVGEQASIESQSGTGLVALGSTTLPAIILWEKRQLTPTMLKKFGKAQSEEFKSSSVLFKWLDGFGVSRDKSGQLKELHQIYDQDGAEFLFAMLARQVRLLLSAKDDGQLKGAPFIVTKLKKQAAAFGLEKLLQLHSQLLEIDRQQKTSATRLTLQQQLDLLVLSL